MFVVIGIIYSQSAVGTVYDIRDRSSGTLSFILKLLQIYCSSGASFEFSNKLVVEP